MDALALLKKDHQTVKSLFSRFEKASKKGGNTAAIVEKIVRELSVHAAIEEQIFYPTIRRAAKSTEDIVLESLEEHHIVKWTLSELEKMKPSDERFLAKVTVLIESVKHHVKEEEEDMFPKVRRALSKDQLELLGKAMAKAKKTAPTRPHPTAPDTPPGNHLAGIPAALFDKARDAGRTMVRRVSRAARTGRQPGGNKKSGGKTSR